MNYALIFAGGTGQRMNSAMKPKQFLEINGKPIIIHTVENFEHHPLIDGIVIVCLENWINYLSELIEKFNIHKVMCIVPGGKTGQESIKNGLEALNADDSVPKDAGILIHDGVRPLINAKLITDNIEIFNKYGNAVTVVPSTETIITVDNNSSISNIFDRNVCYLARAPQTFRLCDILEAHRQAEAQNNFTMIDSAMLMEWYGAKLHIVDGPVENIKITTPLDFYVFKAMYENRGEIK